MSVYLYGEVFVSAGRPLWNALACEVGERLDQLSVAKNSKSAISLSELSLVRSARIITWLAFDLVSVIVYMVCEIN
jgi:hypothetical protein